MKNKLFLGIDVGSSYTKAVVVDEQKKIIISNTIPTEPVNNQTIDTIVKNITKSLSKNYNFSINDFAYCISTGYGRNNVPFADENITEISCHAKGVMYFFPDVNTIIDIGGQDSKVIKINKNAEIENFAMNEKCAAGTGRFLEILSKTLKVKVSELDSLSFTATNDVTISSMCTVFAESEIISKLAYKIPKNEIIYAVYSSIITRVLSLGRRLGIGKPLVLAGGLAKNKGILELLIKKCNFNKNDVYLLPDPQTAGALGAAIYAFENCKSLKKKDNNVENVHKEKNLSDLQLLNNAIDKYNAVIGWTDLAVPIELLSAAGINILRLMNQNNSTIDIDLPYIKTYSCIYFKNITISQIECKKNPIFKGIVTTNECIARKQMYDYNNFLNKNGNNILNYIFTIPKDNNKNAIQFMKKNLITFKNLLEEKFKTKITDNLLRDWCSKYNEFRKLINEYNEVMFEKNLPNAAKKVALILEEFREQMNLSSELLISVRKQINETKLIDPLPKKGPNILIMGGILPNLDIFNIFTNLNCQLTINSTTHGMKFAEKLIDLENDDIYEALAERCLYQGYNPSKFNISERINYIKNIIREYCIEAVIFNIPKFCVFYNFEAGTFKKKCDSWNIPMLIIETDYDNQGFGQMKTRIEAFIEILNVKKSQNIAKV